MTGRHWAYIGIGIGGAISVYGNVAEEFLHPQPALDSIVLAAAAPVVLFVMIELLTAVRGGGVAAWVVRLATLGVAAVAFSTSYQHLRALLLARGETPSTGLLYPLGIDGLLIGAAAVLWQIRTSTQPAETTRTEPQAVQDTAQPEAAGDVPQAALTLTMREGYGAAEGTVTAVPEPAAGGLGDGSPTAPAPAESAGEGVPARERPRVAAATVPRDRVTASTARRSDADLHAELVSAIAAEQLPAEPSAEAIRTHLKVAPARARALRDALRN